jgi:hypothetical protein
MAPSSAFTARHPGRTLFGVAVPSASLLARSLMAPATHAAIGGCRSDLIVTLSNGDALDVSTVVDDTTTDVQQVRYTLHAQIETWVTSEVVTSVLGPKDTFRFYADEPPSTCRAATRVDTLPPPIPVATATDLLSVNGTLLSTAAASGQCPQTLWMDVSG